MLSARALLGIMIVTGLLPFGIGTLLAGVSGFGVQISVVFLGLAACACLILAALAGRETFAFGVGRWPKWGSQPPERWDHLAYWFLGVATVLGVFLQFILKTGDFTIPLVALGAMGGYFCFAPPLHWYKRGVGEVAGALCFGLLPVLAGFYLQCRHLISEVLVYGLPLSLAAFNMFLVHGIPEAAREDQPARYSLAERLSLPATGLLFTIINILTIVCLVFYLLFPAAPLPAHWGLWALLVLTLVNQELVKRKAYYHESRIRLLCWLTVALHFGMGLIFTWALWFRL